ncbi:MAG: PTS sugar transporter subunit IIA [Chthoniobacteraceae bacterium]|nr:PTS sugar transporter subunit IIA [Chthoniobacteraceae bacterium]
MITIGDILSPKHILLGLEAGTHAQAIAKVAELLESDSHVVDWERLETGLLAGSSCMSGDSGSGLCIAHVRTDAVNGMIMAAGRSAEGIPTADGTRVRLVFVIGVPVALASDYLRIIGALARIFRTGNGEAELLAAQSADAFLQTLRTLEMEM